MAAQESDQRTVAHWTEYPYTAYEKRSYEIEHRVVIEHYGSVGTDVRHEVRSADDDSVPDEWAEVEAYEVRDHGLRHVPSSREVLRS